MGVCENPKKQASCLMMWLESGKAGFLLAGSAKLFFFPLFEDTGQFRTC